MQDPHNVMSRDMCLFFLFVPAIVFIDRRCNDSWGVRWMLVAVFWSVTAWTCSVGGFDADSAVITLAGVAQNLYVLLATWL